MLHWLLIIGPVYVGILIFLAWFSRRGINNASDFMMGGFNVGTVLGFMTFAATLFSTFTMMGMPDFFRIHGIGAWIFLAVSDGAMVYFILWFGYRLRALSKARDFRGMSGLLKEIYDTKWASYLYFAVIFIFLIPYVAIQIRGISIFLDAAFQDLMPYWAWALIIVGIMIIYSETGGLKAIMYSDTLQGILLLTVVWIIAFRLLEDSNGMKVLFDEVKSIDPELLSVPGPAGLFNIQFLVASFIAILMIPVTQPQISTRLMVMRSLGAMKRMSIGVGFFAMLVIFPTVIIGMYGAVNYTGVPTADFLSGVLIYEHPELLATLVMIGLIAAAISTSDSQIFAMGSELRSLLKGDEISVLKKTKAGMLIFAFFAFIFSLISSDQLVMLARVSFAGTAMISPVILVAVFFRDKATKSILWISSIAVIAFILSLIGWLPPLILKIQTDLFLFIILFITTALHILIPGKN
ncbi:MAG: sodium:solute symporter family protein [Cyclobacteriaceae bacterium]|nr:sodium:solute symporter family protein [Cyclobacteriaceae bacterium]